MSPEETGTVQWSIFDYIYRGPWWKNGRLILLNILLLVPLMTSIVNGLDSSLVNGLQLLPEWQDYFQNPGGKTLGFIIAAQFIGNLVALPLTPVASDVFGRRAALFVGAILMCAGVGLQAAAGTVPVFIGARIIIGFGLSFCQNAAPLLLIELAYPTQRGKITSMFNSCWYFGSILSAWLCYGSYTHAGQNQWSWRVPTLAQGVLPVIQILSVWFMPESPRWLVSKGRESEAAAVLAKYHSQISSERDPLVMFEMAQIRHAIRIEEEINESTSYRSLFTIEGNRKRMRIIIGIALFSQWSGNGLVSYYIGIVLKNVGITRTETQMVINGCLQLFNFAVAMGAALLVEFAGRRPLFLLSNAGMLVSFVCWTITTALWNAQTNISAAKATIPLIFIFYFFYDLAYTPVLIAYALEILPFRIRAKGFALMNLTMMATAAFNQFVNPWAIAQIGWWYYIFYCGWLVFELVFIWFYIVETKRRTLEETAALFDGPEPSLDLTAMGGQAAEMTVRLNQVTLDEKLGEPKEKMESKDTRRVYFVTPKRYTRDSDDMTASSTDLAAPAT